MNRTIRIITVVFAIVAMASIAYAQDPTKDECLDAHSRGQDAKDQGKLTLARKLFMSCAQSSCPQLVSNDCARFADDLGRLQPTVMFAARDGSGADLPDTTVYIDDMLVATRLDDGRPHDVDPGKHTVRFTNAGRDQTVTVVIGAGEQGRTVVASFGADPHVQASASTTKPEVKPAAPQTEHPMGAKVLLIGGAALAVGGGAFGTFELLRVPSGCSLSDHQCAAAPGDAVFADAQRAVNLANIGWAISGIGLAAVVGGAIWYVKGAKTPDSKEHFAITPWVGGGTGGLVLTGAM